MTIDQISVFVENNAGRLAEIAGYLGSSGVNIRAMSIADTTDYGILRIIVDNPQKALKALKDNKCMVAVTPVIAVSMKDEPGGLSSILSLLSDNGISVEYLYAFITRELENAYVIMRVEDNEKASEILTNGGFSILDNESLYKDLI